MKFTLENTRIAVVGLGYVGLPLALELAKYNQVTGFDIHDRRIKTLQAGEDFNHEMKPDFIQSSFCAFTNQILDIKDCNVYIITVPTPIDDENRPDLTIVKKTSEMIGALLSQNDIIVYESTVYPGVTEEICAPILEQKSGLKSGEGFYLGYSPERINPGDTKNTLLTMSKVVAGQTPEIADFLCALYGQINGNNIHRAVNIKTAEAAKAIENAQRDINVAFINEITMILNKLDLSAYDVLEAARTKWNFLPFTPGLVGGHCIGVDPYYLAECALENNHDPKIILSGRSINDSMGEYFAKRVDQLIKPNGKVLILGFTFKENISDTRNTKVSDVIKHLRRLGHSVDIHDPQASVEQVKAEYGFDIANKIPDGQYDAIFLAVSHNEYLNMSVKDIESMLNSSAGLIYDIKSAWSDFKFTNNIQYLRP